MQGCGPKYLSSKDSRGWGVGSYSVHVGYEALLAHSTLPCKSKIWNIIWALDSLPKFNIFCWRLTHGKILTGKNLQKQGFNGPYRCGLCNQDEENIHHLFLDCPFAKYVWDLVLSSLFPLISWSSSPSHLFQQLSFSLLRVFIQ